MYFVIDFGHASHFVGVAYSQNKVQNIVLKWEDITYVFDILPGSDQLKIIIDKKDVSRETSFLKHSSYNSKLSNLYQISHIPSVQQTAK